MARLAFLNQIPHLAKSLRAEKPSQNLPIVNDIIPGIHLDPPGILIPVAGMTITLLKPLNRCYERNPLPVLFIAIFFV